MCKILCLWKTRVLQDMHFGNRKYKSRTENVASTHNITVIRMDTKLVTNIIFRIIEHLQSNTKNVKCASQTQFSFLLLQQSITLMF